MYINTYNVKNKHKMGLTLKNKIKKDQINSGGA